MTANNTTTTTLTYDDNGNAPTYSGSTFKITGSPGRDVISGDGNATNTIDGGAGADILTGGTGNDTISGGEGNDTINPGANPATGGENITGGAGDDTIVFGAEYYKTAADQDVVDGGDGTDTLSLTTAGVALIDAYSVSVANALNTRMSNMEQLIISDQLNTNVALDMARLDGINHVTLADGHSAVTSDESLIGMTSGATIVMNADNNADTAILTVTLADATGSADVINFNMVQAATDDYGVLAVAATETLNISATEATAAATVRVATLGLNITNASTTGGTTLNVSGTEAITVDTAIEANVINSTITGATGNFVMSNTTGSNLAQTITTGAGADTINAGGGADVIVSGGSADIINGGSGADTITSGEGADVINGGAGSDSIDLTEVTSAADAITIDYSNRGVDIDTIKAFAPAVDDININHSEIFADTDVSAINVNADSFREIFDDNAVVVSGNVVLSLQTAAGTVDDGAQMIVLQGGTFLTEGDVEEALETGGTYALTVHANSDTVGRGFLVAYTDGTDAKVAAARAAVQTTDNSAYEAGDLTVTDLFTIEGITAITATTFAGTTFDYF
jgi:Ca2+-binding RTX toxin-like protein